MGVLPRRARRAGNGEAEVDMPHDRDYPYPIRILAFFLSDSAVLRFDLN